MIETPEVVLQQNNMPSYTEEQEELNRNNNTATAPSSSSSAQSPLSVHEQSVASSSIITESSYYSSSSATKMMMMVSPEESTSSSSTMNESSATNDPPSPRATAAGAAVEAAPPSPSPPDENNNDDSEMSAPDNIDENSASIVPAGAVAEDMSTSVSDTAALRPPPDHGAATLPLTEEPVQPMDTDAKLDVPNGINGNNQDPDASNKALHVLGGAETATDPSLVSHSDVHEVHDHSSNMSSKKEVMAVLPAGNYVATATATAAVPLQDGSADNILTHPSNSIITSRSMNNNTDTIQERQSSTTMAAIPEGTEKPVPVATDPATSSKDSLAMQQQSTLVVGAAVTAPVPGLKAHPPPPEVIDLLDDDDDDDVNDDDDDDDDGEDDEEETNSTSAALDVHQRKRQKLGNDYGSAAGAKTSSLVQPGRLLGNATAAMDYNVSAKAIEQIYRPPTSYVSSASRPAPASTFSSSFGSPPRSARTSSTSTATAGGSPSLANMYHMDKPHYIDLPPNFVSTWKEFMPGTPKQAPPSAATAATAHMRRPVSNLASAMSQYRNVATAPPPIPRRDQRRYFQLSLLNVYEFTITGLPVSYDSPPTTVTGLRAPIRQISREHGKAVYERDSDSETSPEDGGGGGGLMNNNRDAGGGSPGGGKWRIPLGAYQAFYAYLRSDKYTQVDGIPQHQLQIASLARERQAKGYPTVEALIKRGVPTRLSKALAPFQRGGVDFVLDKNGRALIADDMGLGKTIQGIASMSVYHKEWPLLVLCPSSARYHWEAEFQHWLGPNSHTPPSDATSIMLESTANAKENRQSSKETEDTDSDNSETGQTKSDTPPKDEMVLHDSQIHVLTSSRAAILPNKDTKVVICSYGLVPLLIKSQAIMPGIFRCAIVDESHMLKNKSAKRTAALVPVLAKTDRCVLLSGTPALARPAELWPQLCILGTQRYGWWEDETEFIEKYVKKTSSRRRAELHTMLSGTIMIRRLKVDILKTLPKKRREKAIIHVIGSQEQRDEFKHLLKMLREGKGAMGKLARTQHSEDKRNTDQEESYQPEADSSATGAASNPVKVTDADLPRKRDEAVRALQADIQHRLADGRASVQQQIVQFSQTFGAEECRKLHVTLEQNIRTELDAKYQLQLAQINNEFAQQRVETQQTERTAVLSRLYSLTGDVKTPLIVDMLNRWLDDPTKGKLCIFAHHISVLDAIGQRARLSNSDGSSRKFIRIDGSTSPRGRQQQISAYQSDPLIRVALLGITAAGVAVTLTACSTVWFAELFWTPAIMIQAEDRCHRIGQQARVKCLYFVAKGTVDDVLWRLIEKKFQDLGEFVEGKEKLKMVVDQTYTSHKDLFSIFQAPVLENDEEDDDDEDDADLKELLNNSDIEHDIEALGEEEQRMLRAVDAEDEEGENQASTSNKGGDQKTEALVIDDDDDDDEDNKADGCEGRSEEAAITLSDDEADAKPPAKIISAVHVEEPISGGTDVEQNNQITSAPNLESPEILLSQKFIGCRMYQMFFRGPSLGLEIVFFHGRVVIAKVNDDHRTRPYGKPSIGDVIVAVNGHPLAMATNLAPAREAIRDGLQYPPVLITFAEDPMVQKFFENRLVNLGAPPPSLSNNSQEEEHVSGEEGPYQNVKAPPPPAEDIIELSDSGDED